MNLQKSPKTKKCRVCKSEFVQINSLHITCRVECAITYARQAIVNKDKKKAAAERKLTRARKIKMKTRAQWLKEAQTAFNAFIRERDKDKPCISCDKPANNERRNLGPKKQFHAGHYLTVGANPELRFHPFNNNKQCAPCNNHLSGNIVNYRPRLIEKIGLKNVEWLEGPHELQKLTIDDAIEIKAYYKEQLKILKAMTPFDKFVEGF